MAWKWWRPRPVSAEGGKATAGGDSKAPIDIGVAPAKLPAIIEAVTSPPKDLTDAHRRELERDLESARARLGMSAGALDQLLRDIGEAAVPPEQQPECLAEIASRHKDLLARIARTASGDPSVREYGEARAAIEAGEYNWAEQLLNEVKTAAVGNARRRRAAEAAAENGELAMTRLRYRRAAAYFAEAADLLPRDSDEARAVYLDRRRRAEAEPLRRRAIASGEKGLPADHPNRSSFREGHAALPDAPGRDARVVRLPLGKGNPGEAARPGAGRRGTSGEGARERSRAASGRSGGLRRPLRGLGRRLSWVAWGFIGGLGAALAIQQAFVLPLGRAGLMLPSWNFRPAPPLDVPAVALTALSGGLWGVLLALLLLARHPRPGRGYWLMSASFGAFVPTFTTWLIGSGAKVPPSGTAWLDLLLTLVFNCLWGVATALILLL